jgi:hypothetical protein
MANQTITQLPSAGALTGTESVPIVQNGQTVQTTVGAIAASPSTNFSFITATSEPSLTDSRQLAISGNGLSLTDGGAGGNATLALSGAAASLVAAGTGIQVKTSATTLTARSITAGTAGLSVADGDGVAGNPAISLTGMPLYLAQSAGVGLLTRTSGNSVGIVTLQGTANQVDVANGTGDGANPTIGLADDPILPGTGGMIFPKGTTVERLSPGVEGAFRYNTQTGVFEGYTGAGWGTFQIGSGVASFSAGTTGFTPSSPTIGGIVLNGTLISSHGGTGLASYTAGDTLYYAAGTALSKLAIGATSRIMTSSGSAPQWTDPATITVGTATSATTTTNLAGGTANQIAVQSNVGTTTFITAPSVASTVLSWNGSAFTWTAAASGTVTAVTASAPLASSGGTTPDISLGTVTTANGGTGLTTYTAGDLLYYATGTALSKLGIGASTYILTSSGTAPQYTDPATITVGVATTATNVTGGAAGSLVYQTASATTSTLALGTQGYVLRAGASAPEWAVIDGGTF